jgi:tRNA(Leu) C34 or U34 (ribose-2'-O)-methylase TrmL
MSLELTVPHAPIHVVLVHPEIHWNTGNAGRTCLAAGATLHLVKPLGFPSTSVGIALHEVLRQRRG